VQIAITEIDAVYFFGGYFFSGGRLIECELCVPSTLSALMRQQNRLSWLNDRAAAFLG
jgi:hypothetical protein